MEFGVRGVPQTKGNHRVSMVCGHPKIYDANGGLPAWEREIKLVASRVITRPLTGPVALRMVFRLPRPKSVKRPFPVAKNRHDLDKLIRAVGDALTGVAYDDDAQVVQLGAAKIYADAGEKPGVMIAINAVEVDQQDLLA